MTFPWSRRRFTAVCTNCAVCGSSAKHTAQHAHSKCAPLPRRHLPPTERPPGLTAPSDAHGDPSTRQRPSCACEGHRGGPALPGPDAGEPPSPASSSSSRWNMVRSALSPPSANWGRGRWSQGAGRLYPSRRAFEAAGRGTPVDTSALRGPLLTPAATAARPPLDIRARPRGRPHTRSPPF